MYMLDIDAEKLAYEERLRRAERSRRLLVLVPDKAGQPDEKTSGLMDSIKQWFRARRQQQKAADARRATAI